MLSKIYYVLIGKIKLDIFLDSIENSVLEEFNVNNSISYITVMIVLLSCRYVIAFEIKQVAGISQGSADDPDFFVILICDL